jgi:hypothetical protein
MFGILIFDFSFKKFTQAIKVSKIITKLIVTTLVKSINLLFLTFVVLHFKGSLLKSNLQLFHLLISAQTF